MFDDLIASWEDFELELRDTVGNDQASSKVLHMIKNRFAICTDMTKFAWGESYHVEAISRKEADAVIHALNELDKRFFGL